MSGSSFHVRLTVMTTELASGDSEDLVEAKFGGTSLVGVLTAIPALAQAVTQEVRHLLDRDETSDQGPAPAVLDPEVVRDLRTLLYSVEIEHGRRRWLDDALAAIHPTPEADHG